MCPIRRRARWRCGRNFLIGLVHDNPNAQMVLNVQQGILEALQATEFEMVVRPVDRGSATMLDDVRHFLERQRLFGVVLLPPISENDALARLCDEIGCRYVPDGLGRARRPRSHGRLERPRGGARAPTDLSDRAGPPPDRPDRRAARLPLGARAAAWGSRMRLPTAGIKLAAQPDRPGQLHVRIRHRRGRAIARSVAAADRDLRRQ